MLRAGRLDDAARWTALKAALAMGRKRAPPFCSRAFAASFALCYSGMAG